MILPPRQRWANHARMVLVVILGSALACSKPAPDVTSNSSQKNTDNRAYGPSFLAVKNVQIEDHSPRGHGLEGVAERGRAILIQRDLKPNLRLDKDSGASLTVSIENQCTPSQCFLIVTMEYTAPDPNGFNFRHRVGEHAPMEGSKYEDPLRNVLGSLLSQLHLWRQALDMSETSLKDWVSFSNQSRLDAALLAAKDRGLFGLAPFVFRVLVTPTGEPYTPAVNAAAALAQPSHRAELKGLAISKTESKAIAALKVLGLAGLASRQDLNEIHALTSFESVRVEASFQMQNVGESSGTKSSDTTE